MSTLVFDTLRLSRTLRDKGHFTSEQAEALAEALGDAAQNDLVTKADLKADLADLKAEILKWVIGAIGFQTLIVVGAIVALSKATH